MAILVWILVGLVLGVIAKMIMGEAMGWAGTIIAGILGALLGGVLGGLIPGAGTGNVMEDFTNIWSWVLSIVGTLIVLAVYNMITRGRTRV